MKFFDNLKHKQNILELTLQQFGIQVHFSQN